MTKWEYYLDVCYYDMWAVRKEADKNFNSLYLFHLNNEAQAKALCELLNQKEKDTYRLNKLTGEAHGDHD